MKNLDGDTQTMFHGPPQRPPTELLRIRRQTQGPPKASGATSNLLQHATIYKAPVIVNTRINGHIAYLRQHLGSLNKLGNENRMSLVVEHTERITIWAHPSMEIVLKDATALIRNAERQKLGLPPWREEDLAHWEDGQHRNGHTLKSHRWPAPYDTWEYHRAINMLVNPPDAKPSVLTEEEIVRELKFAIRENQFDPKRAKECARGICLHTREREDPCPLFPLKLRRCVAVRMDEGATKNEP